VRKVKICIFKKFKIILILQHSGILAM